MMHIKELREAKGYTQAKLAALLNVSRTTVAMWETDGREPSNATLAKIANLFNVPTDFIVGAGIFKDWELIVKYYGSVVDAFFSIIPADLEISQFSTEKYLVAWLDTRFYFDKSDIFTVPRFFEYAVRNIEISPAGTTPDGDEVADVSIELTSTFSALIELHERASLADVKKPTPVSESGHVNIVKLAGRDGSYIEKRLSDKELQALKAFVDLLPDAPDDL